VKITLLMADALRFPDGRGWAGSRRRYAYAPTTLTLLAALVPPELRARIELIDEGVQAVPERIETDLLAISATTPNALRAYEIADEARAHGIPVVMGGYHATLLPEEALGHADAVVRGYADASWPALLRDFAVGRMRRLYDGGGDAAFESAGLPAPRRDLLRSGAYFFTASLEATRGCTNGCSYCVIPFCHGRRIVRRPIEAVVEEIRAMRSRHVVFFDVSLVGWAVPTKVRRVGTASSCPPAFGLSPPFSLDLRADPPRPTGIGLVPTGSPDPNPGRRTQWKEPIRRTHWGQVYAIEEPIGVRSTLLTERFAAD